MIKPIKEQGRGTRAAATISFVALILAVACGNYVESAAPPVSSGQSALQLPGVGKTIAPVQAATNPWEPRPTIPMQASPDESYTGYRHDVGKSRFWKGEPHGAQAFPKGEGLSFRGAHGSFGQWANGFVLAVPDAMSPSKSVGPLTTNAATHSARVRSYFESAGLPTEQVGGSDISTDMEEAFDPSGQLVHHKFLGYTTTLSRQIDGIKVAESHASAQFNSNDDVVFEAVWWPALPRTLKTEAENFRRVLEDSVAGTYFRSRLPPELVGVAGELIIHHSRPLGAGWYAAVTMDYAVNGSPEVWHFNSNGDRVKFDPDGAPVSDPKPGPR